MKIAIIFLCLVQGSLLAQSIYPLNPNQDIQHYTFKINVNDSTDVIVGEATITYKVTDQDFLDLDLTHLNSDGKGMTVDKIVENGASLTFDHHDNRLHVELPKTSSSGKIIISYYGIPANGLIIGRSKFDERVFFGDNYPDRARNWLPSVDHPADKATVTWIVSAPNHYEVVANGLFVGKSVSSDFTTTIWDEQVPISTKVMVFAAANFAVVESGVVGGKPVSTWVYEKNKDDGFKDFAVAPQALTFYDSLVGGYPYEKLANVQSKTMYGGMENASNIFYFENSVNGKAEREELIAHEIVHQWFGNSVTEKDWSDAWLSEGFATYLTNFYVGRRQGKAAMLESLKADRKRVIAYWYKAPLPIVNYKLVSYPEVDKLFELLSTNTYEKAGWVLYMLNLELGDEVFWNIVRTYYNRYRDTTASTADFQRVVEEVSRKDLDYFFKQWMHQDGHPQLTGQWQFADGKVIIDIVQNQSNNFVFPLEIGLLYGEKMVVKSFLIDSKNASLTLEADEPDQILFDPDTHLLYEGDEVLVKKEN